MNKIFAITLVKDEVDIIHESIDNMYNQGIDGLIIADNLSSDGTYELLCDIRTKFPNFHLFIDREIAYYQSTKMTKVAHRAAAEGAEWILPFDADELWYARGNEGSLCSQIRKTSEQIINGVVWHMTPISEPTTQGAIVDMVWRREAPERFPVSFETRGFHPLELPWVAC